MIGDAYRAYREVVKSEQPNALMYKPHPVLKRAVDKVQGSIGTDAEVSVLQLEIPELIDSDTLDTYQCRVFVVSPDPDTLVSLLDELHGKLKRNQGPIHNRYRPRTQNVEGLGYLVAAVTFQIKI